MPLTDSSADFANRLVRLGRHKLSRWGIGQDILRNTLRTKQGEP